MLKNLWSGCGLFVERLWQVCGQAIGFFTARLCCKFQMFKKQGGFTGFNRRLSTSFSVIYNLLSDTFSPLSTPSITSTNLINHFVFN